MFKATKPFNDKLTSHPEEPSLRIGNSVPDGAVNLAYYYNPTATDSEKVLTAEAPRQTIDHRVEEAYRYLFNQASNDDNLFPGFVWYQDEEGYQGRLGRMYVNWYPEAHIETKNHQETKDQIVTDRSGLLKTIEYPEDTDGYSGTLYLDAADFEVYSTKNESVEEKLERQIFNFELNFTSIFGTSVSYGELKSWLEKPGAVSSSKWPSSIDVKNPYLECNGGNPKIVNYINTMQNPFDEAVGVLTFDRLEYEPVYHSDSKSGTGAEGQIKRKINTRFKSPTFKFNVDIKKADKDTQKKAEKFLKDKESEVRDKYFEQKFEAKYNSKTDKYEYTEINKFLKLAEKMANNTEASAFAAIRKAMSDNNDIVVFLDEIYSNFVDEDDLNSGFFFYAKYAYRTSTRGSVGESYYNVIAVYKAVGKNALIKTVQKLKTVPDKYIAHAHYTGLLRKVWYDYDGMAYYRGAVTKGNSIGNMNPEDDNELLMFSDKDGYLRRPVYHTTENGALVLKNYYRVEADSVYLTDVFKNNTACFYKYPLKNEIYDYRGPDKMGYYEGDAVKIYDGNFRDLPKGYEYNIKLKRKKTEIKDKLNEDGTVTSKEVPVNYEAYIYTSFISSSTDTFNVTYNAYKKDTESTVESGINEEIYNYPFMSEGKDYSLEVIDKRQRINRIKLNEPYRIPDTRHYVTFTFKVHAVRKGSLEPKENNEFKLKKEAIEIVSEPITVSILNKDYALPAEYNKFIERGYIISPQSDGIYLSPMDIILRDQAGRHEETKITNKDKDFIFWCDFVDLNNSYYGAVNIKCNPDGSGTITAETTIDTGFIDGADIWGKEPVNSGEIYSYTTKLSLESPYWVEDGYIYPGIKVKCIDSRFIKVLPPREEELLESWYPRIQFGHYSQVMDQYGAHTKVSYAMPEYDTQHFSDKYKKPYVDIEKEKLTVLNSHMLKTKCFPIAVINDRFILRAYRKVDNELFPLRIRDISYSDGIIILKDSISENDLIVADYTYLEESFVHRGYWRNKIDFGRIDLNPNIYHTYNDLNYTPSKVSPTKNLFNKVIYFFMRPTLIYEVNASEDSLVYDNTKINVTDDIGDDDVGKVMKENITTLYHQIDNPKPEKDSDIYIGSVFIRQNSSLHSTILIDSRTRGGGIIKEMSDDLRKELEPDSDFYLDIGYYDGEPYQENGVIVVRLDNSILKEFGGRFTHSEVEERVKRWLGFGVYPIIEFVDSYSKSDLPQYNLEIEDSYTNVMDITPEIYVESVA